MDSGRYMPLTIATAVVVAVMVVCSVEVVRHIDASASPDTQEQLGQISTTLSNIEQYECSVDRHLDSIDYSLEPPATRIREGLNTPQSCPGDQTGDASPFANQNRAERAWLHGPGVSPEQAVKEAGKGK